MLLQVCLQLMSCCADDKLLVHVWTYVKYLAARCPVQSLADKQLNHSPGTADRC